MRKITQYVLWVGVACLWIGCQTDLLIDPEPNIISNNTNEYKTEKVIIVVIDGPRFTETWGETTKQYIPNIRGQLVSQGVVYTHFYNEGPTWTVPGHAAITTGRYQMLDNGGQEYPHIPSIFQLFLNQTRQPPEKAFIVAAKRKLYVLSDCKAPNWRGKFIPCFDTEDRSDQATYQKAMEVLNTAAPHLMLIHFKGPDSYGHQALWEQYLQSIRETDEYVWLLWEYLQQNPNYRDKTALLLTNDHGRHSDGIDVGFSAHGDTCEGCRHINFMALGPDFKKGAIIHTKREQIDIAPTLAQLIGFSLPEINGTVMRELFKE